MTAQITLGNSTSGTYDFVGSPPDAVFIGTSSGGITGSGTGFFPPDSGNYAFGDSAVVLSGPLSGGNFSISYDQPFTYTATDGDSLTGVAHWHTVKDHSLNPDLIGILSINSSTGDTDFTNAFTAGGTVNIDLTLILPAGSALLDDVAANGGNVSATISSGEIVPIPNVISEPATLILLGIALTIAWLSRGGRKNYNSDIATAI